MIKKIFTLKKIIVPILLIVILLLYPQTANIFLLFFAGFVIACAFNPYVKSYTASTSEATVAVNAAAKADGNTVEIKNGGTTVENGEEATLSSGNNTITVSVKDSDNKVFTYTVNVTKTA